MPWFCILVVGYAAAVLLPTSQGSTIPGTSRNRLVFQQDTTCTYSYEVSVNTGRGSKSTESQGYQLHTLIDIVPVSRDNEDGKVLHVMRLTVREPRMRRVRFGRVITRHPVNEEIQQQLSKPFYFRQHHHGSVVDSTFSKDETPEALALKKGIAGAFQVNIEHVHRQMNYTVSEHDDSGVYRAKYTVMMANDTHAVLQRKWTNYDYQEFADGSPAIGEHKVQSQHQGVVHIGHGQIKTVHRTSKARLEASKPYARAENLKGFQKEEQDIEMWTSGYSTLKLLNCRAQPPHQNPNGHLRENLKNNDTLTNTTLVFTDSDKINWSNVGGEKPKTQPLFEILQCINDPKTKESQTAECVRQLHRQMETDPLTFDLVENLVLQRAHQNVTSWAVLSSSLAGNGKYRAQKTLAHALKADHPSPLTVKEYEVLLEAIFYLPKGPLHQTLYDALFNLATQSKSHSDVPTMAMLVLAGLTKRAQQAGYNTTLCNSILGLIQHSYRNKSNLYHPESGEHESYLRNHIWALGNLGHLSGLEIILQHRDHDSSGIRSAVVSAMRKLPPGHTDHHLMRMLYQDEHSDVKASVIEVMTERHQDLHDPMVKALEHAIWSSEMGDTLDSQVKEFLENHGKHPKALHLRKKRRAIHRHKRALIPALRPREFELGPKKRWDKIFGGKWLGAESMIQFINQLKLRIGIFGGNFEINLDNLAYIRAHLIKFKFDIVRGRAAFKASASFKNDIPKDLIHAIADAGDDLLKQVDGILNVIVGQIEKFRFKLGKYLPLQISKFLDFVNKLVKFVQNLVKPLKPINVIDAVLKFAKKVIEKIKNWKWLIDKIKSIQVTLGKLTFVDDVFKNVLTALNKILSIIHSVSLHLPHNLPGRFNIKELLKFDGLKQYFSSIGLTLPKGFKLQFPFSISIKIPFSMGKFRGVVMGLLNFANKYLDMSSLLDAIRNLRLPRLPFKAASISFKLNLKTVDFSKFLQILSKLGDFFTRFGNPNFDLERFFKDILPGNLLDVTKIFKDLFGRNSTAISNPSDPVDVLGTLIRNLINLIDFKFGEIIKIDNITNFFKELGPELKQFAEEGVKKVCGLYKLALNSSQEFKAFGENVEKEGIVVLKEVENVTQKALSEMLHFTKTLDSLIDTIEWNFTLAARGFVAHNLQELSGKLKDVQNLADQVIDFANGTTAKATGVCMKAADFSADVIDDVQANARKALSELTTFIGPVATSIKRFSSDLRSTVTRVETWYNDNLKERVGKFARIAQIISDVLSVLNTKKGFLGEVRKIADKINDVLTHLKNLPDYANKARKVADDISDFANRAQNFKDEIKKLDVRKQFGIDYDQKVRDLCEKFKEMAGETLDKIASYDIVEEVNKFFTKEADKLIHKAVTKFRVIKEPIAEIQVELTEISTMVRDITALLVDVKPFTKNFSPILETAGRLPDCLEMKRIFLESTRPCVAKAMAVGRYTFAQYKDMKKEVTVLYKMIPETWKNFKIQKCVKGGTCISKAFIDQAKVVKKKVDFLKDKFTTASGYTEMLSTCEKGVNNITAVIDTVKLLIEQVKSFDLKDDVQRVKDGLKQITGRKLENEKGDVHIRKRSIKDVKEKVKRVLDYLEKAKDIEKKMKDLLENTFEAMKTVYDDAILQHVKAVEDVRRKLQLSYNLWKKTKDINAVLQAFDDVIESASDYAEKLKGVTSSFNSPIVNLLTETGEITQIVKPKLDKYAGVLTDTTDKINNFLDKVTNFLNSIQLRQRGLDPRDYKPWNQIPYCSEEACVRSIRQASPFYLKTIFVWKFPHLDDLSSMKGCGRWLTPGLFDDYKTEGITQFSKSEMILGMHGVVANANRASLLVLTSLSNGHVKKIIQLGSPGSPFTAKISGVTVARDIIWISEGNTRKIHRVSKSSVAAGLSSSSPSWVGISKSVTVEGTASSVSYDEVKNVLWVTDGQGGRAYAYKLSSNGDLIPEVLTPDRVLVIGKEAQGMTIVRQFSTDFACISRCADIPGYQCKLEFHDLSGGDEVGENTLSRVVRTPSGLESVQRVDNDFIVVAFSSGTFALKEKIELQGGDFEDRYFKMKLPILKMTFGIYENCLFFRVMKDYILFPRRLFPIGEMQCGQLRKRSVEQQLLEADVYSTELEGIHKRSKHRGRRAVGEMGSCVTLFRGETSIRGYHKFFPDYKQVIIVFGIPVTLFAGAGGYYFVDFQGKLCARDKVFKLGIIPGAWIAVHVGASVSLWIVEAGITIEARLLETYLVPELSIKIDKWPLKACLELKMQMTPLSIRVWLWYRFRLCIRIRCKILGCSIRIRWCSKKTLGEWWWRARTIDRTLFSTCKKSIDRTPPIAGSCTARQAGDKKYFVQWHGFQEDTRIGSYWVRIGSIEASGDDFSTNLGTSLSLSVPNIDVMHGRDVYVSVVATNEQGMDSQPALCPKFTANRREPQLLYVYDGVEIGHDLDYQSDNYALGLNYAIKGGMKDVVSLKWGISSAAKCTLDDREADVTGMMSLGDSPSIQTSGLGLKHGNKYFTRVVATNSIGLKSVKCSDGVVVDTTAPKPVYLQDGTRNEDADYLPSIRRVRAKYLPFTDPESPMVKYQWKIVTRDTGLDVTPFVNIPLTQRTPMIGKLSLTAGKPYKVILQGTNAAGLQAVIQSNGFVADGTAPVCQGRVLDVTQEDQREDVDFVKQLKSLQAKWQCQDKESTIKDQLIGVGTYPGGDDVRGFQSATSLNTSITDDGMTFVRLDDVTILPRTRYHVTVRVINGAGIKRTITSDGILIDTSPPGVAPELIKDGLEGRDKNYTNERYGFDAHWEQAFADAESGVVQYLVGLGSEPGSTDVRELKSVGRDTKTKITGVLLVSGQTYYVTIVGCNGVKMCVNGTSNGALVDFVPPHAGTVKTGYQGPVVFYQWINTAVWARWDWCLADEKRKTDIIDIRKCRNDSFYDKHSGISGFGISVLSMKSDELLQPFKESGRVRFTGRQISMDDGIYSVAIEAKDRAGETSRGLSNTFIVDSSPPQVKHVQHGYSNESLQYLRERTLTFRAYIEVEDDLTKIVAYKVGVGSYPGADDVVKFQTVNLPFPVSQLRSNWRSSRSYSLENGRKYYISVWATNSAGLFTIASSKALISDWEPPKNGVVLDGWGLADNEYQSYSFVYRVHWYGFSDFSGVDRVYVGLTSTPRSQVCEVSPLELVPSDLSYHVLSGFTLQSGRRYYACLKATDKAGNAAYYWSNGLLIDTTPPRPGYVQDGKPGVDIDVQTENSILRATWGNFTDDETVVTYYQLAFGTSPGGIDIQDFTKVGLVTAAVSSRLKVAELTSGQRYYATVIAYNVLGMPSLTVSSDGVLVDFTPPEFSLSARDGLNPSVDQQFTSTNTLSAVWSCEDDETGVKNVQIAFGVQPGGSDAMNFTTVPSDQKSLAINLSLKPGYRYFATVRCTNNVGLKTVSVSNGVIYDRTPPRNLYVKDGDYQSKTLSVDLSAKFVDPESGISRLTVFVRSLTQPSETQGPFIFGGNMTTLHVQLARPLKNGGKYFVNVTATNGIGLVSSISSDGFIVDTTSPVCTHVWDGNSAVLNDLQYISKSSQLTVSWQCQDNESPITRFRFTVRNSKSNKTVLSLYPLKESLNSSRSAVLTGNGRQTPEYLDGNTYVVGIELTNAVELKALYWTDGVTVDSTPPLFKDIKLVFDPATDALRAQWKVYDDESGLRLLKWGLGRTPERADVRNLSSENPLTTSIIITGVPLSLGRTYFLILQASNKAGLSSQTASNGVVIDRTSPTSGTVSAHFVFPKSYDRSKNYVPGTSFVVSWTGIKDTESGVDSFSWAVGTDKPAIIRKDDRFYSHIPSGVSVGGAVIHNRTITANKTYYVCIRATNGAGLQSTSCSQGMLVVLGKFSAGVVSDGPVTSSRDTDFQLDDKAIWAHWEGFEDPVFGVTSYDWCIGTNPPLPAQNAVCLWPFKKTAYLTTHASRFHNLTLNHGSAYYVTVRAANSRGETVESTSDGVVVDRTPPTVTSILISPTSGKEILYLSSQAAPVVTWSADEPESAILHFFIAVGSFPFQEDIISSYRISGLNRSLDLDLVNLTLTEGMSFFVTVTAVNMLGLETSMTSQQVVVDWSPPVSGQVADGNRTEESSGELVDVDYQSNGGALSAHWLGFADPESDIVEYHWCVGTKQGVCDVQELTSSGLDTHFTLWVRLEQEARYYVTVKATNGAGLSATAYSDGVKVDTSPPRMGRVGKDLDLTGGQGAKTQSIQSDSRRIQFLWERIDDVESGITETLWCAGTRPGSCYLVAWKTVNSRLQKTFHAFSTPLPSGTIVYITMKARNGAGMTSLVTSPGIMIDSSPPTSGHVIVGNAPEMTYLRSDEALIADWSGFTDKESGIHHYEWAVCLRASPQNCLTGFVDIGTKKSLESNNLGLKPGETYALVIRAYNKVHLYTEVLSSPFLLDESAPKPGVVFDGSTREEDTDKQSSTSDVSANWEPFRDPQGSLVDYSMCVGSRPGECDTSQFVSVGTGLTGTISGLSLKHGSKYFVTVRGRNSAGYTTTSSSDGTQVDATSPVGAPPRDGQILQDIDLQRDGSFISANWDEFRDPESGVTKYEWCAGTRVDVCDVISRSDVGDRISVGQQITPPVASGMKVFITLSVFNGAGAVTTVYSDGVLVDDTPPEITKVRDLQLGQGDFDKDYISAKDQYCASWDAFDSESGVLKSEIAVCSAINSDDCVQQFLDVGNKTFVCIANLQFKDGVQYMTTIRSTNKVGLTSVQASDGFILDSSPPFIGRISHTENAAVQLDGRFKHFTDSVIAVIWSGFWDRESAVDYYLLCIGTKPETCDVMNFTATRNQTSFRSSGLPLTHAQMYFVSVTAVNRAGLKSSMSSSDGVTVDKTAPITPGPVYDGSKEVEDIDYQRSNRHITAHWNTFDDPESDVTKLSWCAGSTPRLCDIVKSTDIAPTSTSVSHVPEEPLKNGQRFYITIQATNGAGVRTSLSSDGVVVDTSPPDPGVVIDGYFRDVDYVSGDQDLTARWFDFKDMETGIKYYEIAVCDSRNLANCPQPYVGVNLATNVTIAGLDLDSGVQYQFKVRATNMVGLQSEATSDGFSVDFTPPEARKAWIGGETGHVGYQADSHNLRVRWLAFTDPEGSVVDYEICVGLAPGNCTVSPLTRVGLTTNYTVTRLQLLHGVVYYVTIRGWNAAGQVSEAHTDGVFIDITPPKPKEYGSNSLHNETIDSVRFQCSEEWMSAEWDEFEDKESGSVRYMWCVGRAHGKCDVVPLSNAAARLKAQAITDRLPSGTKLYASVTVQNSVGLKTRLSSAACTVVSIVPKISEIIDVATLNATNSTDIDWKAMMETLSLRWRIVRGLAEDVSRMRVQVLVTQPSLNSSYPRLDEVRSWQGEPIVHGFMDLLPWQQDVTIRSLDLKSWQRYRGVVRVYNSGGIYAEAATDGLRIEPRPPPVRSVKIDDRGANNEHLRWLPYLKIPPVNQTSVDPDVTYFASPGDIQLLISSGLNRTNNSTAHEIKEELDKNLLSPTREFRIVVSRVTSQGNNTNNTNTTEHMALMKTLPGFVNPEGPCCSSFPVDAPSTELTDSHFKPTLPTSRFGYSVARLTNGYLAVGSAGKASIFSAEFSTSKPKYLSFNQSYDSAVKVMSRGNKFAFITSQTVELYTINFRANGDFQDLVHTQPFGTCRFPMGSVCSLPSAWAEKITGIAALNDDFIAVTGSQYLTNTTVVGVFSKLQGSWKFVNTLQDLSQSSLFGHALSVSSRLLAVASTSNNKPIVFIYSLNKLELQLTVDLSTFPNISLPLSIFVTEEDILIANSRNARTVVVIQLNLRTKSYTKLCTHVTKGGLSMSGSIDVSIRYNNTLAALGVQSSNGQDGVQLIGFSGMYSVPRRNGKCVDLGRVLAREPRLRVDDGVPRASVSFNNNKIIFGTPGVLTWPGLSEKAGTGRVYVTTFCPPNYMRMRTPRVDGIDAVACQPCESGRKSFGGFAAMCSACEGRSCASSPNDDPVSFNTNLCGGEFCEGKAVLNNRTRGVKVNLPNGTFFVPGPENLFTIQLFEETQAGTITVSFSEPFLLDTSAPEVGVVYDGFGSDQNMNCSNNETFGEDSQCSTRNFVDTDIDYTNNTSEIHARWIDFYDNESDISQYFWCVGSEPMRDNIRDCESTGLRPNGSHFGLNFKQGDKYFVTVLACNGAHRCSATSSNGVTIDTTPPVIDYVRDGVMGPDMDYQAFLDIIFAYYRAHDPDSGVTSYEVAWGTAPGKIDVWDYEEVGNTTIWFAKVKDNALQKGKQYYATVRATNAAGLLSQANSSNGIVVGKSEYLFDNESTASFFFDTVNANVDGSREDGGVGKTYGTLDVPAGAVQGEVKLRSYSMDEKTLDTTNKTEEGPIVNPKKTKPKQFMLGNYSFQIKALDPKSNTVKEGYKFAKPIEIAMFYDVDNLVNANKKTVNKEVTSNDIDPVLLLWDKENQTWFDAALTCPSPWSFVNRTIKMLTVKVCHLTQFAFFWTFFAQNGLIQFDKTDKIFGTNGEVLVSRKWHVSQLELPIRRGKGANGNISVTWAVTTNGTGYCNRLIWPSNGTIDMASSQWNSSVVLNVANSETKTPEQALWITLQNTSGGAVLAKEELIRTKIVITSNMKQVFTNPMAPAVLWGIISASIVVLLVLVVIVTVYVLRRRRSAGEKDEQQETYIIPGAGGMYESVEMNHTDGPDGEMPISSAKKKALSSAIDLLEMRRDSCLLDSSNSSSDSFTDTPQGKDKRKKKSSKKKKEKTNSFQNPIYGTGPLPSTAHVSDGELETSFTAPAVPEDNAGLQMVFDWNNPLYDIAAPVKQVPKQEKPVKPKGFGKESGGAKKAKDAPVYEDVSPPAAVEEGRTGTAAADFKSSQDAILSTSEPDNHGISQRNPGYVKDELGLKLSQTGSAVGSESTA